jgi:hypothetical protein
MGDPGSQPREWRSQSDRLPAERRQVLSVSSLSIVKQSTDINHGLQHWPQGREQKTSRESMSLTFKKKFPASLLLTALV